MLTVSLLEFDGLPIFEQLRLEEALLRVGTKNYCILNSNSPPSIILGLANEVVEFVDLSIAKEQDLPVYRRFSGGGAVVVDHETIFCTFIFDNSNMPCECSPEALISFEADIFSLAFAPHILEVCERDYALYGKKIGGNAQSFTKGRTLQHTSFLYSWKEEFMGALKVPKKQPAYRLERMHTEFCGKLKDYFPSRAHVRERLRASIEERFYCESITFDKVKNFLEHPYRKSLEVVFPGQR